MANQLQEQYILNHLYRNFTILKNYRTFNNIAMVPKAKSYVPKFPKSQNFLILNSYSLSICFASRYGQVTKQ